MNSGRNNQIRLGTGRVGSGHHVTGPHWPASGGVAETKKKSLKCSRPLEIYLFLGTCRPLFWAKDFSANMATSGPCFSVLFFRFAFFFSCATHEYPRGTRGAAIILLIYFNYFIVRCFHTYTYRFEAQKFFQMRTIQTELTEWMWLLFWFLLSAFCRCFLHAHTDTQPTHIQLWGPKRHVSDKTVLQSAPGPSLTAFQIKGGN